MTRNLAQIFVSLDDLRKGLAWDDAAHILSIDGLNAPLGFVAMLVEHPDLPRYSGLGDQIETVAPDTLRIG